MGSIHLQRTVYRLEVLSNKRNGAYGAKEDAHVSRAATNGASVKTNCPFAARLEWHKKPSVGESHLDNEEVDVVWRGERKENLTCHNCLHH